jgi:hypothetical protein
MTDGCAVPPGAATAVNRALHRDHDTMGTPVPLGARHVCRDTIAVFCRPLEETRTPSNSCNWLAECQIGGEHFEARSRVGAPNDLARVLVAAGVPDAPMVVSFEGLCGTTTYRSFHEAAKWTYSEGPATPLRRVPFKAFDACALPRRSKGRFRQLRQAQNRGVKTEPVPLEGSATLTSFSKALSSEIGIGQKVAGTAEFRVTRCGGCASEFRPRRLGMTFCSGACRQRAYRDRLILDEAAE